jgi:hypothetical protein
MSGADSVEGAGTECICRQKEEVMSSTLIHTILGLMIMPQILDWRFLDIIKYGLSVAWSMKCHMCFLHTCPKSPHFPLCQAGTISASFKLG